MPIYEYLCHKCHHKFSILVRSPGESSTPPCPRCQCQETSRVFSVFSVRGKTDKDIYEDILGDQQLTRGMLSEDPRSLAEWNRRMSQGLDQETAPEYEEMLERMEKGEMPSPEMMQELKGEKPEKVEEEGEGD